MGVRDTVICGVALVMHLAVGAEGQLAVLGPAEQRSDDDGAGAELVGDSIFDREGIKS